MRITILLIILVAIWITTVESQKKSTTKATEAPKTADTTKKPKSTKKKGKNSGSHEKKIKCPSFVQTADFSKPDQLAAVQSKMLTNLWSIQNPKLSCLGESFKEQIIEMGNGTDPHQKANALATSQWIWAYLPQISDDLNLCSYASMINSTVRFIEKKDCSAILSAIKGSITALAEAGGTHIYSGIVNAGCATATTLPVKTAGDPCYNNGFTFRFTKMWNLQGKKFPCEYRKIVYKLYKSSNKVDNIIALLATAALSKQMAVIENNYAPALKYQIFAMATPGKIDKCCCENFLAQIQTLGGKLTDETNRVFELARESTQCPLESDPDS